MRRLFKMNVFLCSIFLVMLGILGTKTPISQVYAADSKIAIQKCVGGDEMAIVEFAKVAGCNLIDYAVSYQKQGTSEYTTIDKELIRDYDSYIRADLVGLTPGTYSLKVKAGTAESTITNVVVTAQDRSGYAHFNATEGVGAYNNDGSLKSNAQVVYVTETNKNTVQAKIGSKTYTGLANILNNQKGTTPLVIRVIGQVAAATWKGLDYNMSSLTPDDVKGQNGQPLNKQNYNQEEIISAGFNELDTTTYSQLNGLTNRIKYDSKKTEFDSYYNMLDVSGAKNVTLEGIGTDAVFFQWGLTWKSCSSIEVRNLTFKNYPEDACSFEGSSGTYSSVNDFKSTRYWVHHNTFYLGVNTWDVCNEQDKHDGDGCTDFKYCAYVTVGYNHYIKTHKTGLVGGADSQQSANFTYHHNFYDTCQARLPFARQANLHLYNNYYYASTGNNMQIYAKAYAFIEYCYFENVAKPMIIDDRSIGKAAVKIYETTFNNCGTVAGTKVTSRTAVVENDNTYGTQFDQNATQFYYDATNQKSKVSLLHTATEAKEYCKVYSGALKESFTGNGGAVIETLTAEEVSNLIANLPEKSAVTLNDKDAINAAKSAYDSLDSVEQAKVTNVTKLNEALEALQILLEAEQPEQPEPVAPTPDYIHNFTESGIDSTFFSITGNLATNKGTVEYNGLTLTQCLKMESSTIISFTITEKMKLTLVFGGTTEAGGKRVKINDKAYTTDTSGIAIVDLEAGTHKIIKVDSINLFYMSLASTSLKAVIEDGMVGTAVYQNSNSLRMVTKLTNVADLASIVSATYTIEVYQNENDSEPKYTRSKVITKAYSVVNGINSTAKENEYYIVYILTNIDGNNGELDGMTFKITCSLELADKTITSNEYSFVLTLNEGV